MTQRYIHTFSVVCLFLLPGCGPEDSDIASAATTSTTDAGDTTALATDGSTSSPTDPGADTATTAATGPGPDPAVACGDGVLEDEEACDDGNPVNGDGCNKDCTASAAMVWEYRSGLPDNDTFNGVAASADGRIVVVGAQVIAEGVQDRWIVEFQEGVPVWSRTYDHGPYEQALAVAVRDSTMYVAGTTMAADNRDAWTGKLDLDGKVLWEDEFDSGLGDDFLSNLAVTAEGDVVVTGVASVEGGLAAMWTRRYGASGDVQWTHQIPYQAEAHFAVGPGVAVTADQVLVGFYRTPEPDAPQAVLLAYPPGGGEPLWMKDLSTRGSAFGVTSEPGGALTVVLQDLDDGLVVDRTTSTGQLLWSSKDCTGDWGKAVAIDGQGDIVAIGGGWGAVDGNIRLCKFTAEGKLRWGKDLDGGLGDDYGLAVAILPDDRIVAAGRMWGGAEGKTDAWLAVFTP